MPYNQKQTEKLTFRSAVFSEALSGKQRSEYMKSPLCTDDIFGVDETHPFAVLLTACDKCIQLKDLNKLLECKKLLLAGDFIKEFSFCFVSCVFEIHLHSSFLFVVALLYTISRKSQVILHKSQRIYLCNVHKY